MATPANILARLRKTERQFRDNSILAALDVEARQLFTFYKKVDITAPKDQKALLLKFGYVLRSNSCTIAYKTAARLPDLMKPEQARLYRLFITAIVSSIKLLPTGNNSVQPIGPNLCLVEINPSTSEQDHIPQAKKWVLYRIDLQVVPSGHIILTIAKDEKLSFLPILPYSPDLAGNAHMSESMAVYLAPIGRIARVSRSYLYSQLIPSGDTLVKPNGKNQVSSARRQIWRELLPLWLKEHMNITIQVTDVLWMEVEVGVEEFDRASNDVKLDHAQLESAYGDSMTWRKIFWPANLCFLFSNPTPNQDSGVDSIQDPMQFVWEWIHSTGNAAVDSEPRRATAAELDDEPLFAEEGTFDDPDHFQPFGPPAFPATQSIYPTPPDIGMTHPTPGLSLVDGVAMTPANMPSSSAELAQQQDEDMPDFEDAPPASGMAGYYDEDLFEEMPDDNFGQETNGDEPNWDFFDGPGVRTKPSRSASRSRKDGSTSRNDPKQERIEASDGQEQHGQPPGRLLGVRKESLTLKSAPTLRATEQAQSSSSEAAAASELFPAPKKPSTPSPPRPAPPLWQSHNDEPSAPDVSKRRRSSIFDSAKSTASIPRHDNRYDAEGDYWFDPSPVLANSRLQTRPISRPQRPPTSPSESDTSMSTTSESIDSVTGNAAPALFRQWTEYSPDLHEGNSHDKQIDKRAIQKEAQQVLGLLKPGLVEPPTVRDFEPEERNAVKHPLMASKRAQDVVQVLVDQMSQTSLISQGEHDVETQILCKDRIDMNIDLSGIKTAASPSNLFQLTNLTADLGGARLNGRVNKLRPNQVCVRRIDRPLTASMSIMTFWDTLNLQPEHGPKDVTAFCIHPHPENVRDGSLSLLQRLADVYTRCTLGIHSIGMLPGLTEDGLISWTSNGSDEQLLQSTTAVGNALAATSNVIGTVIIYMISIGESPTAYLQMCIAFYNLFESFTKARTDNHGVSDIQLQIIPQSFIANPETLVIPAQTAYLKLAIEVYNRLPPLDLTGPPAACGSAVVLARSENAVRLQLTPIYASPMEKNGPCLHLAYSVSQDKRWLAAVWTDELGRIALSMSYCSYVHGSSKKRPRSEIFKEMWEASHDLMGKARGPWRLAVVKHGYHEPAELTEWHHIFDGSPASQKRCLLLLLSIQLYPELALFPTPTQGKHLQGGPHNHYGTPASTPQANITSPDQIVPATPTPGGSSFVTASTPPDPGFDPSAESDLLVVDPSDESWGIVLPYGLNQSRNMTELRPSQVTGFLLKRRGPKSEDGHTMVEVSLVKSTAHISNKPNDITADELLEDLIRQYRGLVILAASRGCVDPNHECVPWHLATAIRGARILEQAM